MTVFVASRIDDMLRVYSDKQIQEERAAAEKIGEEITPFNLSSARHRGECLAWVMHDSFFVWQRPLSNTYDELRAWITEGNCGTAELAVRDWQSLRQYAIDRAVNFIQRQEYPPLPAFFEGEHHTRWWMYMATIHECDRQLGK